MTAVLDRPARPARRGRLRSPALLGPLSQGITSVSNVAMTLVVAGALTAGEFGAFALIQTAALVVEGLLRAALGETMAVTGAAETRARRHGIVTLALSVATAVAAVGVVAAWLLLDGRTASLAVAVAVGVVPRVWADAERLLAFAVHEPAVAVVVDTVWLGAQVVLTVAAVVAGLGRPEAAVWAWGAGALLAAVVGARALATGLRPAAGRDGLAWLAEHRSFARAYAAEFLMVSGSTQAVLWPVALLSGADTVAALRGAQLIFGPVATLVLGLRNALTPQGVALAAHGEQRKVIRLVVGASVGAVGLAVADLVIFALVPDGVGRALLGGSWPLVAAIVLPYGLSRVCFAGSVGPLIVLRVKALTATGVRLRTVTSVLAAAAVLGGVLLGGAEAAAWLSALAAAVGLGLYLRPAVAALRPTGRALREGLC